MGAEGFEIDVMEQGSERVVEFGEEGEALAFVKKRLLISHGQKMRSKSVPITWRWNAPAFVGVSNGLAENLERQTREHFELLLEKIDFEGSYEDFFPKATFIPNEFDPLRAEIGHLEAIQNAMFFARLTDALATWIVIAMQQINTSFPPRTAPSLRLWFLKNHISLSARLAACPAFPTRSTMPTAIWNLRGAWLRQPLFRK